MVEHAFVYFEVHRIIRHRQLVYLQLAVLIQLYLLGILKTNHCQEINEYAEARDVESQELSLGQLIFGKNAWRL